MTQYKLTLNGETLQVGTADAVWNHVVKNYGDHTVKNFSDAGYRIEPTGVEQSRLLGALRKIANCNHGNVVKYIQYVDGVALDALAEFES